MTEVGDGQVITQLVVVGPSDLTFVKNTRRTTMASNVANRLLKRTGKRRRCHFVKELDKSLLDDAKS